MRRFAGLLIVCATTLILAQAQSLSSSEEREMVRLINRERSERGLSKLELDDRLTKAARGHTALMIERDKLAHRLPGEPDLTHRLAAADMPFDASGENVAYNSDVESAHIAFMESPGHRANILKPEFNTVGIGIQRAGDRMWVTQAFARRVNVTSPSEAMEAVAKRMQQHRKKAGLPPLTNISKPQLSKIACSMARKDRLRAEGASSIPEVRKILQWTAPDPEKLPDEVERTAADRAVRSYSLGACYAASDSYPSRVFWLVLVTY